jgi:hypothetical protein
MKKRLLAAFLWFYAGWYAGAILADVLGVSPFLGPLIGAAAAALIVGDPRRIIWSAKSMAPSIAANSAFAQADDEAPSKAF